MVFGLMRYLTSVDAVDVDKGESAVGINRCVIGRCWCFEEFVELPARFVRPEESDTSDNSATAPRRPGYWL